jgi:hypothetical protein
VVRGVGVGWVLAVDSWQLLAKKNLKQLRALPPLKSECLLLPLRRYRCRSRYRYRGFSSSSWLLLY